MPINPLNDITGSNLDARSIEHALNFNPRRRGLSRLAVTDTISTRYYCNTRENIYAIKIIIAEKRKDNNKTHIYIYVTICIIIDRICIT